MWWRSPFDALEGRIGPSGFDVEGIVVPAYALFALALGVLAGLVFRRTVAAMTATLLAFAATRFLVSDSSGRTSWRRCTACRSPTAAGGTPGDWVLSDTLVDGGGRQITAAREDLAVLHAQQAGIDPHTYIVTLGWRRVISYQPAGRFWTFQVLEAGLFVGLAVAVVLVALWLVRRTPRREGAPRPRRAYFASAPAPPPSAPSRRAFAGCSHRAAFPRRTRAGGSCSSTTR